MLSITPDTWHFFYCAFERSVRTFVQRSAFSSYIRSAFSSYICSAFSSYIRSAFSSYISSAFSSYIRSAFSSYIANFNFNCRLIQQLHLRFSDLTIQGLRALCFIPSHLFKDDEETIVADDLYKFYSDDLPFPQAFHQEIALWKTMWNNSYGEMCGHGN